MPDAGSPLCHAWGLPSVNRGATPARATLQVGSVGVGDPHLLPARERLAEPSPAPGRLFRVDERGPQQAFLPLRRVDAPLLGPSLRHEPGGHPHPPEARLPGDRVPWPVPGERLVDGLSSGSFSMRSASPGPQKFTYTSVAFNAAHSGALDRPEELGLSSVDRAPPRVLVVVDEKDLAAHPADLIDHRRGHRHRVVPRLDDRVLSRSDLEVLGHDVAGRVALQLRGGSWHGPGSRSTGLLVIRQRSWNGGRLRPLSRAVPRLVLVCEEPDRLRAVPVLGGERCTSGGGSA